MHRTRPDVIAAKEAFIAEVVKIPLEQLVFVDEMGVNLAMTPTMARAPIGEQAFGTVPTMYASNVSVAAAVRSDEVVAWYPHDGAVDGDRFVTFLTDRLVPKLRPGDVVVMDNIRFHKSGVVKATLKEAGVRILFIPAYHPEFNAIEEAFSVVKRALRCMEPRSIYALFEALGAAFAVLTAAKLRPLVSHMLSFAIQPT